MPRGDRVAFLRGRRLVGGFPRIPLSAEEITEARAKP